MKNKDEERTRNSWSMMKNRCLNPNASHYEYYGGRGIKICEGWLTFSVFMEDMGLRPEGKELDRIDWNGDYCPENCRWATRIEQMNNCRRNYFINFDDKRLTISQWARVYEMDPTALYWRVVTARWPIEKALKTPSRKRKPKMITYKGKTLRLSEWCKVLNKRRGTVNERLRRGWSFEKAVNTA